MNKDQTDNLEKYLHAHIPLSATMQVSVCSASTESVVLSAPLEPNINHKSTVFGGSASAVAILSAWSLLHVRLEKEACRCEVVIQSNCIDYDRPISGMFMASSSLADPSDWAAFMKMLVRKKRARIEVHSTLTHNDAVAGRLKGSFVAFLRETP